MLSVGLKVLKNRLAEYVRMAAGGERVLVTDHDRVVAELGPPLGRGLLASDAYLAEAVRQGWLSPPMGVREGPPPRQPVGPLAQILGELDHDRGER